MRLKSIDYIVFNKWRPQSLIELTRMIFNKGLTHLGFEASKYVIYISGKLYGMQIETCSVNIDGVETLRMNVTTD